MALVPFDVRHARTILLDPSLKSQGTHRPVQDGKTRKIKGSFAYSVTKHRYTNIGIYLDNAL